MLRTISRKSMGGGFTLIELLVVIVIIGIIASLSFVALNSVRSKTRDTKRIADIRQIQSALEMYKNDNNVYPTYATSGTALVVNGQTYMAKIPSSPTNTGNDVYTYTSTTGGTSYAIAYNLEKGVQDTGSGNLIALPGRIAVTPPPAAVCGNGVIEGAEVCDSNLTSPCPAASSYFQGGYVRLVGYCQSYGGCNASCNACIISFACDP